MDESVERTSETGVLILSAAFVVVIAGMRAAQPLIVPFIMAVFLSVLAAPPLFWMMQRKVPKGIAIAILICIIVLLGLLVGMLIGSSINDFTDAIPEYQTQLRDTAEEFLLRLERVGIDLPERKILSYFDPGVAMRFTARTLGELSGLFGNTFLILLTVVFILSEASTLPDKLDAISSAPGAWRSKAEQFLSGLKRYFAMKTWISATTGILIWLLLLLLDVAYPALWGLLAFFLNFIPNIGSIIAAIPAVLVALVQHGAVTAGLTAAGFMVVNITLGSLVEPRFLGRGLGLSTLVVFLSLVFWGWILGPVGMLLSVPLTVTVKIALESNKDTRWIAVLLDSEAPN